MEKKKNSAVKRLIRTLTVTIGILAALAAPGAAEEQKGSPSPGEAIGEATRQIKEDSKSAYQSTREAVVQTSRKVVDGARNTFRESKDAGTQMVKDVKKGFKNQGHQGAPADASPSK